MYDIVVFLVCFCGVCVFVLQECAALLSWLDNLLCHLANFLHNHLLVHNWPGWPVDVWGWSLWVIVRIDNLADIVYGLHVLAGAAYFAK